MNSQFTRRMSLSALLLIQPLDLKHSLRIKTLPNETPLAHLGDEEFF